MVSPHLPVRPHDSNPAPALQETPPLPVIDFAAMGQTAPGLPDTPSTIPVADVIVTCWDVREWGPTHHVFVAGNEAMPYSDSTNTSWPGWQTFATGAPAGFQFGWGSYRLVTINGKKVLLFKSEAHMSEGNDMAQLIAILIEAVKPKLILSTGTAGGTRVQDMIGTVNIVSAGTMYSKNTAQSSGRRTPTHGSPDSPSSRRSRSRASSSPFPQRRQT
jgi:hypothetical protein